MVDLLSDASVAIAELKGEIVHLRHEVAELKTTVTHLEAKANRWQGGFVVIVALGTIATSLIVGLSHLFRSGP